MKQEEKGKKEKAASDIKHKLLKVETGNLL